MDNILKQFGLTYEDLSKDEIKTLNQWNSDLDSNKLTLERVKDYIGAMRFSVEEELVKIGHESKQDIFLKARLRNYMLLEGFLDTPKKAREAIERQLRGLVNKNR
jgi:hypothetical protein